MNEWIKYDGTNPPTDRTKDVRWRIDFGHGSYVTHYAGAMGIAPAGAIAWQYLDPYPVEPEMPDVVWLMKTGALGGVGVLGSWYDRACSGTTRYRRCVEKEITLPSPDDNTIRECECGAQWLSMYFSFCPHCGAEVKR